MERVLANTVEMENYSYRITDVVEIMPLENDHDRKLACDAVEEMAEGVFRAVQYYCGSGAIIRPGQCFRCNGDWIQMVDAKTYRIFSESSRTELVMTKAMFKAE